MEGMKLLGNNKEKKPALNYSITTTTTTTTIKGKPAYI